MWYACSVGIVRRISRVVTLQSPFYVLKDSLGAWASVASIALHAIRSGLVGAMQVGCVLAQTVYTSFQALTHPEGE